MNSARWERVQHLVAEALELPAPARPAFVDAQSAGDSELRAEILSLLDATSVDDLPAGWLEGLAEPEGDRFAPGDLLAGRYRIRHLLGRGGMGEVYEADDEELDITVALKTLRELGSHESAFERLKLEGMLARAVWHPNVCRVYEVGRHDELCFLAMERLHGRTLQERLREEGPFTLERASRIAEQVGSGLSAAHRAGIVHRDLKPANVMLVRRDGEEHAVVMDFGTGSGGRDHSAGMVVGTPAYMAPEQFRGEEVGPAADVYALGLLLCEMVTGILPALEAMPALTPPWDAVIRRCLHPDPRRRFARAEDVFEALAGRATDFTMAQGSDWPSELDAFVGREADLAAVERALEGGLVTLLGPGGMGKTRLAIRSGRHASFAGGAFFCDLTEARSADGIAAAVGRALGVQLGRGDAIVQLGHAIAGRGACLLVLDNFEQVVAHAALTVGRWRELAPEATFLVTSRERLGLEGERVHAVEPLSEGEALGLFTLRARGLRPGFELASSEGAAREIVRLLDGIPLAIELAAARIRVMSVEQILSAMRKRFQLLAGGSGARHETLEGTIDESWELLAPWERAAFSQCAVFEGGCTLEAAAGVLDLAEWPDAPAVVDVVGSLVDKSLLRSWAPLRAGAPEVRFGMYVSLQEYARKRLHASNDAERSAEVRHGNFYAACGDSRAERELDNLVSACRRAIQRGDGAVVAATYRAAWQVLRLKGPLGTALALGSEALADPRLEDEDRAIVEVCLGEANWYAGRFEEASVHCATAATIARRCEVPSLEARATAMHGRSEFVLGRTEAAGVLFDEALVIARRIGDAPSLCSALNGLGMMHHEGGRPEEARLEYEEALAITRDVGDRVQEAVTLLSLGILHHKRGHLEEAGALFEQSLAIHGETGNRRSAGIVHSNLVGLRSDQGRMEEAREHAEVSLAIARAIGSRINEGTALAVLGELYMQTGDVDEARGFFESALTIQREIGNRRMEGIILDGIAHLDWLRNDLAAARAGFEAALAIHRDIEDRHYEGGSQTSLATVLLTAGLHAEARAALDLAEPILREIEAHHELARTFCVRAELEQSLGDAAAAHAALAEAEAIVAGSNSQPGNELRSAFARARSALAGVSA